MYGRSFKQFWKWMRDSKLTLSSCDCGMWEGEHDVDCSLVLSEEKLFEQWRNELDQKGEVVA